MANAKKEKKSTQITGNPIIPLKYQHFASIAVIFISLIVFFNGVILDGKVFVAADNIASKSFQTLVGDAEQQGVFPLWNPYIFCGMPGYASLTVHGERYFDVSALILNRASKLFALLLNNPEVGWELFYYFLLGIGIYCFVYDKLKNKVAALISSLAVMHSTFIVILVMVGHMTKVPVIAFFPFIFLIIERIREKFDIALSLLLVLLIHFMLLPGHIQMIFYCYFAFLVYYVFFFIRAILKKDNWIGVVRSGMVLTAATCIAFAMTGDQYLSIWEYSKYSTRGADPILNNTNPALNGQANNNGGLDYGYATQWSFPPGEMLTFVIPFAYGFGNHEYQGVFSDNKVQQLNTYIGSQTFTDAPQYMGVIILFLAAIGFWRNRKDPFVQFVSLITFISLVISFGKELPVFFNPMFYYFPMFNKFRIPSMILILVQIFIPIAAGYGVKSLLEDNFLKSVKTKKLWQYGMYAAGACLVISVVAKDIFLSLYQAMVPIDVVMAKVSNQNAATELYKYINSMVAKDIIFGFTMISFVAVAFYLFWEGKIKSNVLIVILVIAVLVDLWSVNYKPMDPQPHKESQAMFAAPGYVRFIQQDTSYYRTLEFEQGQPPYNNTLAYWRIQSAYGYQGAKMRQTQDMFDVVGLGNPLLWGLMNVKYILSDRPDSNQVIFPIHASDQKYVLYNRAELPRAFFVNRYEVTSGLNVLNNIKEMRFDPKDVAYMLDDPKIKVDAPKAGAKAEYTHLGIQDLELKVNATGNNLLFLSESWYPVGWKAYVDGNETAIHRLNYMFRGIIVPQGEHKVTMSFEPNGFYFGKNLSLWINLLILGGLGYFGITMARRNKKTSN
ncbi:MAG: YfhO family protein [Bacteroidota bacterium]